LCLAASTRRVAFSNQIYNIICNNHSLDQCDADEATHETIDLFEGIPADVGDM
jgi:hypothetical protein